MNAVNEIEQLIQVVTGGASASEAERLSKLVGETGPVVDKLYRKASETDPAKQTYGPKKRQEVLGLAERWAPLESLARDLLQQRGLSVGPAPEGLAAPPPAPRAVPIVRTTPGGAPPVASGPNPSAPLNFVQVTPSGSSSRSSVLTPSGPVTGGSVLGGSSAGPSAAERREAAARAAMARSGGGIAAPATGTSSAAGSAGARPPPSAGDTGPTAMDVDSPPRAATSSAASAAQPQALSAGPPVERMEDMLRLVHSVFLGHGLALIEEGRAPNMGAGGGPYRLRYTRAATPDGAAAMTIVTTYVPVQRHLVLYAAVEGANASLPPCRCNVELGMAALSVQAKVDYLIVYPLTHSQCAPVLTALPAEVCFKLLGSLALPSLAALGRASSALSKACFEDDLLWWQIATEAMPQSEQLQLAIAMARDEHGQIATGAPRRIVKEEVQRQRLEAEERQKRELEAQRLEREMRERFMIQQQQQPRGPPRFPGGGGMGIFGGDRDLLPGGGFQDPFRGGRGSRGPFGGGGGFGGGGIF